MQLIVDSENRGLSALWGRAPGAHPPPGQGEPELDILRSEANLGRGLRAARRRPRRQAELGGQRSLEWRTIRAKILALRIAKLSYNSLFQHPHPFRWKEGGSGWRLFSGCPARPPQLLSLAPTQDC